METPTARAIYDAHHSDDAVVIMLDFAKLHVEAALKAASEKAEINDYDEHCQYSPWLDEDSILNSYPLENIK